MSHSVQFSRPRRCVSRSCSRKKAYLTTEEYHQRMTLLIQLENWRWLCCGQCQKLHPRKEFSGLREEYLLGLEPSSPWDRKCSTWAGILDLCPCIAMTLRDRKHIVEHLSGTRDRHKPIMNFMRTGLLRDSLNDKGERCLSHTCPAYKSVQLEITLSIAESGLISCAKYEASPSASRSTLKSIDVCCRRSQRLSEHLDDSATYTCGCYARISPLPRPAASSGSRAVEVTRFLGKGAWLADSKSKTKNGRYEVQWWRQCRREKSYIPS